MQKRQALEPVSKKAFLLHQNQVSELIIGCDSDESQSDVHVTEDEEFCEEILLDHTYNCRVSTQHVTVLGFHLAWIQLVPLKSGRALKMQQAPKLHWTLSHCLWRSVVHKFSRGSRGQTDSEAPRISDGPVPLSVFMLYFAEIIAQLVVEANRYKRWCRGVLAKGPSF